MRVYEVVFPECIPQDKLPPLLPAQLRRSCHLVRFQHDSCVRLPGLPLSRRAADEVFPTAMRRQPPHDLLRRRPRGLRLAVPFRVDRPAEDVPQVGHQRDQRGHDAAAFQRLRREAAPSPLVLHLVEDVLAVSPVAIELGERKDLVVEVRHQDVPVVFAPVAGRQDFDVRELELQLPFPGLPPGLARRRRGLAAPAPSPGIRVPVLDAPPHEDGPPCVLPAVKPEAGLAAFPSLPRVNPFDARREALPPRPDDRRRTPDLEQVLDAAALAGLHDAVHAEADVAPDEPWLEVPGKDAEEALEHAHRMRARGPVAGMHDDAEDEPQLRDAHRVVAVGRPSGLVRVVAQDGALLVPVERLHRRVEVEDVVLVEKRRVQDGVVVEDVEVPVPGMPLQDAAEKRGEHAADRGRVVAGIAEGAAVHKTVEGPADLREMAEEGVVAARRHQRRLVPPALEGPAGGVDPQRFGIRRGLANFRRGIIFHVGFHAVSFVFSLWSVKFQGKIV
jgi:hypothetical protein